MSPPYPTAAEIKAIFEIENGPNPNRKEFLSHVADDFQLKVVSYAHPFPRQANKHEYGKIMEMQESWMDPAHHYDRHVEIVTGGGDNEWAAVELFNCGKTKAGQDYKAEYLKLVRFNRERKMIEMKVFLDSHQFHITKGHIDAGHLPRHAMDSPVQ